MRLSPPSPPCHHRCGDKITQLTRWKCACVTTVTTLLRVSLKERMRGVASPNESTIIGRWQDTFKNTDDDDPEDQACIICSL